MAAVGEWILVAGTAQAGPLQCTEEGMSAQALRLTGMWSHKGRLAAAENQGAGQPAWGGHQHGARWAYPERQMPAAAMIGSPARAQRLPGICLPAANTHSGDPELTCLSTL
jgi:hypothetical protein